MATKWTDTFIEKNILQFINLHEMDRMPTNSELKNHHRIDLSDAISRHGGFGYWANRLKLSQKASETGLAKKYEEYFRNQVSSLFGYETKQMTIKFPYDILVNNLVKVDVKCTHLYHGKTGDFFTCNLETENRKSDLIVVYCLSNDNEVVKTYCIPSIVLQGITQLSIGQIDSKYDTYLNAFHYLKHYIEFYESVKAG